MTQLPGRKPSTFPIKQEVGPNDRAILVGEQSISLQRLFELISADAATNAVEQLRGELPAALPLNARGEWQPGLTYEPNDLVSYTLPDGRIATYVCLASTDTEPTNTDNWQPNAVPAPSAGGGGGASGYTAIDLGTQTGNTYAVNLASEGRVHVKRNTTGGTGSVSFTNLPSLGTAKVAIIRPLSGTPKAFNWPSNLDWEGGTVPTLTETPGRGDVFLFQSFDGTRVTGIQSQAAVRFESIPVESIAGATALWRFPAGGNNLKNNLKPGTNDFVTTTGTERSPFGREIAAGGVAATGRLVDPDTGVHVNFSNPWSFLYVAPGLYADANAGNTSVFSFSATAEDPSANNRHLRLFTNTSSGLPALHVAARENNHTGGVVGPKDGSGQAIGTLPLYNRPVHLLYLEYDGVGQFQVISCGEEVPLLDKTTGTAATPSTWTPLANRFIDGNTATIPDYSAGMLFSAAPTQRPTTVVGTLTAAHLRWMQFVPRVLTLAERNQMYDAARNYMLTVDPTGPQLPPRS